MAGDEQGANEKSGLSAVIPSSVSMKSVGVYSHISYCQLQFWSDNDAIGYATNYNDKKNVLLK